VVAGGGGGAGGAGGGGSGGVERTEVSLAGFRELAAGQLGRAEAARAGGSEAWRGGERAAAAERWADARGMAEAVLAYAALRRPDFADLRRRGEAVLLACHLNLAQAALREAAWADAAEHSLRALALDRRSVKALFRLGQARSGDGRAAEAAEAFGRALELDPGNREVAAQARRARGELRATGAAQRRAFQGMFGRPAFREGGGLGAGGEGGEEGGGGERRRLADLLQAAAEGPAESALLDRFRNSGAGCLEEGEKRAVEAVALRCAAQGGLDAADDREALNRHGLGAALERPAAGSAPGAGEAPLGPEEAARLREQRELLRVRALAEKMRRGDALTDAERGELRDWRAGEIRRLEGELAGGGLSQEDCTILEKMRAQQRREAAELSEAKQKEREINRVLDLLDTGRRVPVRDRLAMMRMTDEHERELEELDDTVGLNSQQIRVLAQLKKAREERDEKQRRQEARQRAMGLAAGITPR